MQTTPLYVSQLAGHIKLPLVKTVQDHTEELFRHRTTLPPLNSTSGTQLHVRVKQLLVWALYLCHDSSLRGQRSPKRGGDWGCAVGAGMGVVTSTSQCPAASSSPGQLLLLQQHRGDLAGSAVLEQPTPPSLSAVRPSQGQSCSLQSVPSPSPSSQNCAQKTGTNNTAQREHFNATNTLKPCYTLYWKDFSPLQLLWGSICYL